MTQPTADPMAAPAPPGSGYALRTQGLVKHYGARPALQGLDLAVPQGVVYGFLGPNGAGKTTLMRLLVGLIKPDAGRIEILGQDYDWRQRARLHAVGALVESPTFYICVRYDLCETWWLRSSTERQLFMARYTRSIRSSCVSAAVNGCPA